MAVQGASPWWGSRGQSPLAFLALLTLLVFAQYAWAQGYPTMASAPDPGDFVKRADSSLILLGTPMRIAGADIPWLGLRRDGGQVLRPTTYEVRDALQTVQALGGVVIRSASFVGNAGCALCLEPSAGHFSDESFAALDQTIKTAADLGLKLILPLAGGADCAQGGVDSTICADLRWHGASDPAAFFTYPAIRADFMAHVKAVLDHVNTLTGVAYRDEPAILAWENCVACGSAGDPQAVSAWVEAVGQAIKAEDQFHLYENGAFAGRILPQSPHPVSAAVFATPSVDIVGDSGLPPGDVAAVRGVVEAASGAVTAANRVYFLDEFDWGPGTWKTQDELQVFLDAVFKQHQVAGALFGGLQGHADGGGYLPAPAAAAGAPSPLYFPGLAVPGVSKDEMEARGRALRRFDFAMGDVLYAPAYLLPPKPEIISVTHGHVVWRGAAGALDYTIERSPDPSVPDSWQVVCDECTTDSGAGWQDPALPRGPSWYRLMPFNINGHKSRPSDPVANH